MPNAAPSKKPILKRQPRSRIKKAIADGTERRDIEADVVREYNERLSFCTSLSEEIRFIINGFILSSNIKISEISCRIKSLDSTLKKIVDKEYTTLSDVSDLIGARIVCLFRNDLDNLRALIEANFQVDEFDEKLFADPDAFGYMSLHFQCRLRQDYSGPRYDAIKTTGFEIQLRTICMHAWSAVQHSLDYKGEWDVPQSLKKDINALSALFYTADSQFSAVYAEKLKAGERAIANRDTDKAAGQLLDLETLQAYAKSKFSERRSPAAKEYSTLVRELSRAGYETIGHVDKDVTRARNALAADEVSRGSPYNAVGAIRVSVASASHTFNEITYGSAKLPRHQELVDPE